MTVAELCPDSAGRPQLPKTEPKSAMTGGRIPRIVIVGGGFGGLTAAVALANAPAQITLIDRRNHHLFQPLLYQVATAGPLTRPDRNANP
ncbi:MAG: FAD-dependent oxidoreductase [Rhizomicrobium sp.]